VHEAVAQLERRFLAALKPTPRLTISEWADRYRMLSSEDSAEPGKWHTDRAEFQRQIMDAVSDPDVTEVVFMKGSQVGWTAMLGNILGFYSHQDPASVLVVQPTVEMAEAWSKERLAPMIRDTAVLSDLFTDPRSRDGHNTLRMKQFPGGYVAIIGANAPAGLASRPIRVVLADEIDRYPVSAGTEGDPLKLASKRQVTFWNRKTMVGSTPTTKGTSAIEREFKRSDMRRFHVPCPHCQAKAPLRWEQVKWDKADGGVHLPETASYQCEHCGVLWSDVERWESVAEGEWVATAPFRGVAGFHLSQLYSPWVSLADMVQEFLEAQGNPELLKVFVNTVLGETWEEQGEAVEAAGLRGNCEQYGAADLPDGVHFATAGVDVQGDRLEIEIVGWGAGDESWGIRYEVLYGDPAQEAVWKELDELLLEKFWTESGRLVRIRAACIDTGGHHSAQVLKFCRARVARLVHPIKGAAGPRPVWPKRASKTGNTKENIWIVGVDTAKDAIYGRFKIKWPQDHRGPVPGYCHLPADYDDAWFEQATSEKVVTRYKEGRPFRVWVLEKGKRNEALDCRVYAFAARMSLDNSKTKPSAIKQERVAADDAAPAAPDDTLQTPPPVVVQTMKQRPVRRMRSRGVF